MPRRRRLLVAGAVAAALVGAGCGGSGSESSVGDGAAAVTSAVSSAVSTTTTRAASTPRTTSIPSIPPELTVPAPTKLSGEMVAVFGDSLSEGIESQLPRMADAYGFKVRIDALSGRDVQEGLGALRTMVAKGGDLLVVALGTNDARNGATAEDYRQRIDSVLATVGPTMPVLWVNVYRDANTQAGDDADLFNNELDAATLRHGNLTVLDWEQYVEGHKEVMRDDRIHLTDEGYTARAAWMARLIADHLENNSERR